MKAQLVSDALTMPFWQWKSDKGFILHSDQGVQYASHQYRNLLKVNDFIGSMSKEGHCWDNAVVGIFFGSLSKSVLIGKLWSTTERNQLHNRVVKQ